MVECQDFRSKDREVSDNPRLVYLVLVDSEKLILSISIRS